MAPSSRQLADTERIQSGYRADTKRIQSGYRADTERIQSGHRADTEKKQSGYRARQARRGQDSGHVRGASEALGRRPCLRAMHPDVGALCCVPQLCLRHRPGFRV